jgi:acetyl-CoA acetyltransferase
VSATAIVGVGETAYRRQLPTTLEENVLRAVTAAVADAGLDPRTIDGFVHAGYVPAHAHPAAEDIAAWLNVRERSFQAVAHPPGGSGVINALELAQLAIASKRASTVLVWFAHDGNAHGGIFAMHAAEPIKASLEMPFGWYGQPTYFGAWAQRYMHDYGLTEDQLGQVAVSARAWANLTPGAQVTGPLTLDDYRASPYIATPLRKLDCALISDGAGAFIVTSAERAKDLPNPPALVLSTGMAMLDFTMPNMLTQRFTELGADRAADMAFARAGLSRADVDFAEVYDGFSINMLVQLEQLGLCGPGGAGEFVAGGRTAPGGAFPVNTHGGHLSHGYTIGMSHLLEAVRQVRGTRGQAQLPEAEIGLVGLLGTSAYGTAILAKER